jgi:hypothetical protein
MSRRRLLGVASAADHIVISIGHDLRAKPRLQTSLFHPKTNRRMYKLASNGEITPHTQKVTSALNV